MKRANPKYYELVVEILTKSFDQNKSVNFVLTQDGQRKRRMRHLMQYALKVCDAFGQVWISDNDCAVALLLFPDKKRTSLKTICWDIRFALLGIGLPRIRAALKREALIATFHPKRQICHLWFIGTDPEDQGRGTGSELLAKIIAHCDDLGRPIYLETSVKRNLSWYSKFGFEIFQTIRLPFALYLLRRFPRSFLDSPKLQ